MINYQIEIYIYLWLNVYVNFFFFFNNLIKSIIILFQIKDIYFYTHNRLFVEIEYDEKNNIINKNNQEQEICILIKNKLSK